MNVRNKSEQIANIMKSYCCVCFGSGCYCVNWISEALKTNSSLTELYLEEIMNIILIYQCFYLNQASIGYEGAGCLGDMLKVNSSLTKLDLYTKQVKWDDEDRICLLKCD